MIMTDIKNGIESLEFKNVSALAETMIEDDTKCYRTAVLPFYNAIWLVRELMLYEDVGVDYLDWYMPEYNDYEGHYYVTLDDDNYLSIEPCYKNGKFIMCGGDIMYIDGEAEAEILRKNPVHKTSYTMGNKDATDKAAGRPETDNPSDNTIYLQRGKMSSAGMSISVMEIITESIELMALVISTMGVGAEKLAKEETQKSCVGNTYRNRQSGWLIMR